MDSAQSKITVIKLLACQHPQWTMENLADKASLLARDVVSVDEVLEAVNDNPVEKAESDLGLLPAERRIMCTLVESGRMSVAGVCRRFGVSRVTFYKWYKRWQTESALTNRVSGYDRQTFRVAPQTVERITAIALSAPSLSKYEIASRAGEVSASGVYNVLKRKNLTTPELRMVASSDRNMDTVIPDLGMEREVAEHSVYETFVPQVAPAPPPRGDVWRAVGLVLVIVGLAGVTGIGIGAMVGQAYVAGTLSVGLVLAVVAFVCGMLFLAYSLKYYLSTILVLSFSQTEGEAKGVGFWKWIVGGAQAKSGESNRVSGMRADVHLITLARYPKVSVQIPLFNEKNVARRAIEAAINIDYPEFEVVLANDSTDETTQIVDDWLATFPLVHQKAGEGWTQKIVQVRPGVTVRHIHRTTRDGFKGGALRLAMTLMSPAYEMVSVFDADFVPYPDVLTTFVKYYKVANNGSEYYNKSSVAAVQGYQWHVLNKSENWITRGVRTEYSGSYVIERAGEELYGGLKQISGSVYMIRRDVLEQVGWGNSITEDFELTLKLYARGFKVVYTPYIQAPAECVSTIRRLIRQRMRWAEGHSYNIKKMFRNLITSDKLSLNEKLELVYLAPYYLQAAFFLVGTLAWMMSELVFGARLPYWTQVWGWSLVATNMLALPLMNGVGVFLEEGERRDFVGLLSFVVLSYLVVPFQAYAAIKGFVETDEGPWFRTPKTGRITDVLTRSRFYRFVSQILPGFKPVVAMHRAQSIEHNWKLPRVKKSRIGNGVVAGMLSLVMIIQMGAYVVPVALANPDTPIAKTVETNEPEIERVEIITTARRVQEDINKGLFSKTFYKEPRIELQLGEAKVELALVGSSEGPAKHQGGQMIDGQAVYPDILGDKTKLIYDTTYQIGVSGGVVTHKPIEEISYVVRMQGVKPVDESGVISFVDNVTNEPVFTLNPAYMYEGEELRSLEQLVLGGQQVSTGIEYKLVQGPMGWILKKRLTEQGKAWLADPNRRWPVTIDPSVVVSGGIVDGDTQFGGVQRKVAYVNGNWYVFHNDGGDVLYKKSTDGVSWGANVDVDTTDADNYNPSIWVKGNEIWVAWIDDDAEDIEFNSINTASADALGTKCTSNLGAITIDSTNMTSIAVQATGTDIYVAQSDTSTDTEEHVLRATSGCTFTDITTGSGIGDGDQPVLATQGDDLMMIFQDGNLSYSFYNYGVGWGNSNVTIAAVTDNIYSLTGDGDRFWVLSQSGTTATNFYQIGLVNTTIDANTGGQAVVVDMDCLTSADCKLVYVDPQDSNLKFVDCNDAACSAPTITEVDTSSGSASNIPHPVAIDCVTATDCKIVYSDANADDVTVVDCSDAACATTEIDVDLDTSAGMEMPTYVDIYCLSASNCKITYMQSDLNDLEVRSCTAATGNVCDTVASGTVDSEVGSFGGQSAIYCVADANCKLAYYDSGTNGSIIFFDCSAAACGTGTATTIDSDVGTVQLGNVDIDCSAGDGECRAVYYDATDGDITFVDCNASATCASATLTDIDTDVGSYGSPVKLDCNNNGGSPDDCKIVYYDGTDGDITFVDCANDVCSSSTPQDIDTDVGSGANWVGLTCELGVTDCRAMYTDMTRGVGLVYVDCNDADCDTPTNKTSVDTVIQGANPPMAMNCPSATDCKLVYYDALEGDLTFIDCNDASCSAPAVVDLDTAIGPYPAQAVIDCPNNDGANCKVVYNDVGDTTLKFADCNDGDCDTPVVNNIDTTTGFLTNAAIYCPGTDGTNCKIIYHDASNADQDLTFVDCNNDACDTPTLTDLDTSVGFTTMALPDIDCSIASTDCQIVYSDQGPINHIDCSQETTCCVAAGCATAGETTAVDAASGITHGRNNIDCVGGSGDCKIAFSDQADFDITFIDCDNAACSSASTTDIDIDMGNTDRQWVGLDMECVSATNCKLVYSNFDDGIYYFVDCPNAACSSSTVDVIPLASGVTGGLAQLECVGGDTDCKVVFVDTYNQNSIEFWDCEFDRCVTGSLTAPWTSETNVLSVALTYDSTNSDVYAHIVKDTSEQAYWKMTDATTISWGTQTSYGFTAGDINHISAPYSGAGTTGIGVVLRQGSNFEFSELPENGWMLVISLAGAVGGLLRLQRKGILVTNV